MKLVERNPFRILGLLVGATAREQGRQISRLRNYLEADQLPESDFSFSILGDLTRSVKLVDEAAAQLNLDSDKINAALFWFYKGNSITDEPALEALKEGNLDEAINIWSKLTSNIEVTQRNASAYSNLSTLYFLNSDNSGVSLFIDKIENAIIFKLKFLESDFSKDFKTLATDETFKISKKQLQLNFLNTLFAEIEKNADIEVQQFIEIIKSEEFTAKDEFLSLLIKKPIEQIEKEIEIAEKELKTNESNGISIGKKLINQVEDNYHLLQSILDTNSIKFISISDKIADEILNCGIGYFNYFIESEYVYPGVETLELCKQAEKYALGNVVKLRYKQNIDIIQRSVDRNIGPRHHQTNNKSDNESFNFVENAWWVLGILGLLIGSTGGFNGAFWGAVIGAVIGNKIKES